jgi:hypothetical protein
MFTNYFSLLDEDPTSNENICTDVEQDHLPCSTVAIDPTELQEFVTVVRKRSSAKPIKQIRDDSRKFLLFFGPKRPFIPIVHVHMQLNLI